MARIRTIKPEFFKDDRLYEAERACGLPLRVAAAGLWCVADRAGRFKWQPRALKTDVLPYDEVDFERVLEALEVAGYLVRYVTEDGKQYGAVQDWDQLQHIPTREPASSLPQPTSASIAAARRPDTTCTALALPEQCRSNVEALPEQCLGNAQACEDWEGEGEGERDWEGDWEREGDVTSGNTGLSPAVTRHRVPYAEIVEHLNNAAGTFFDHKAQTTRALIKARWTEGKTLQQFLDVIDDRCRAWLTDERMRQYLRPATLFNATKMESYLGGLNAKPPTPRAPEPQLPFQLRCDAEHIASVRTPDEVRHWITTQPRPLRPALARAAGLESWSD